MKTYACCETPVVEAEPTSVCFADMLKHEGVYVCKAPGAGYYYFLSIKNYGQESRPVVLQYDISDRKLGVPLKSWEQQMFVLTDKKVCLEIR